MSIRMESRELAISDPEAHTRSLRAREEMDRSEFLAKMDLWLRLLRMESS